MYCTNCGKEIKNGSIFCTECGQRVEVPDTNGTNSIPGQPANPKMQPANSGMQPANSGMQPANSGMQPANFGMQPANSQMQQADSQMQHNSQVQQTTPWMQPANSGMQPVYPPIQPGFGTPYQQDNKPKKSKKKIIIIASIAAILIIAAVIIAVIVFGRKKSNDEDTLTEKKEIAEEDKDVSTKDTSKKSVYGMKEAVKVGDLSYTVNSAYSSDVLPGYDDEEVNTDGMYLTVNLTVENGGEESAKVESTMFAIEDENKESYNAASDLNDNMMFDEEIEAGDSADYTLIFDLPKDSEEYDLKISGGTVSPETAAVNLSIEPAPAGDIKSSNGKDTSSDMEDDMEDSDITKWVGTWTMSTGTNYSGSSLEIVNSGNGTLYFHINAFAGDHTGDIEGNITVDSNQAVYENDEFNYTITFTYYEDYIEVNTSGDFMYAVGEGVSIDGDYCPDAQGDVTPAPNNMEDESEENEETDVTGDTSTNRYFNANYQKSTGNLMFSPREVYYENGQLIAVMYIYNGFDKTVTSISNVSLKIADKQDTIAEAGFDTMNGISLTPGSYLTWTFTFQEDTVQLQDADLSYLNTNSNCNVTFEN